MHYTNRCKQYWMSKWSDADIGLCNKHIFTRRFLNINLDVEIKFEEVNKTNSNLISTQKTNQTEEDTSSMCDEHSLSPNNGLREYSDRRKDMPPTDMPDAAGDIENDPYSCAPCVTRDVANVLPSHTTNVVEDVVNDP